MRSLSWLFSRLVLGLSWLTPGLLSGGELRFQVTRVLSLPSDDGQQGIATDGVHLFVQNTQQLFKYDLSGKLLVTGPKRKLHHGGITHVAGKLYCAVSGCEPAGSPIHQINVYDSESLKLLATHDVRQHFTVCAGGIAWHRKHFFVAESYFDDDHEDRIVQFDATFKHVKTHTVAVRSPAGIQGLEYLPESNQFQVHSHAGDFYRINAHFDNTSVIPGKSDFALQDLARLTAETILVNHRAAASVLFVKVVPSR